MLNNSLAVQFISTVRVPKLFAKCGTSTKIHLDNIDDPTIKKVKILTKLEQRAINRAVTPQQAMAKKVKAQRIATKKWRGNNPSAVKKHNETSKLARQIKRAANKL